MADFILVDGDTVSFIGAFTTPLATVVVQPGRLRGSGPATISGKKICVDGDESKISVPGCPYTTPQCSIAGVGTLKISGLAGDQKAKKTKTGGKAVLLKGSTFTAKFEVQTFAQQPGTPPVPDANAQYSGTGMFVNSNTKFRGE